VRAVTPAAGTQAKTVDIWAWDARASEDSKGALEMYTAKHPEVKINPMNMGYDDVTAKLLASFASGTGAPHITFAGCENFATYMKMDVFWEIPDSLLTTQQYKDAYMGDITTPFIYGGKPYAWGFDSGAGVYYYRNDVIVEQMGLKAPTSWQEVADLAKKVKTDKRFLQPQNFAYDMFLQGAGVEVSNEVGDILPLSDKYFERTTEVYTWLSDLLKNKLFDYKSASDTAGFNMYKDGNYLACAWGNWVQSFGLKGFAANPDWKGAWRISPWLPWKTGDDPSKVGAKAGGAGWAVPKQNKDVALAMDICKATWCSRDTGLVMAKTRSIITGVKACYDELSTIQDPFFGGQSLFKMIAEASDKATGKWFGGPNYELIGTVLAEAMDKIVLSNTAVKDALNAAKTRFTSERKYK